MNQAPDLPNDDTSFSPGAALERVPLVALAVLPALGGYLTGVGLWAARHSAAYHDFVHTNFLSKREFASLLRSAALYPAAALLLWFLVAWGARRVRGKPGEPLAPWLRRAAWAFAPLLLNGLSLAAFRIEPCKELARSINGVAGGLWLALLWRAFDFAPAGKWLKHRQTEAADTPSSPRDGPPAPAAAKVLVPWSAWGAEARVLAVAIGLYALLFTALCWMRYLNFEAALMDLSMYTQQLWGNLRGHWFLCSFYDLPGDTMLAEHFMPIVALMTPFYALWPDPRTALLIQALGVGLAAWPIYLVGLHFTRRPAVALALALSYLLHPLVQTANLYDFHPDAFIPLFSIAAFWALLERRWSLYWPALVLTLACKEDVALALAILGLYAAFRRRHWLVGALTFGLAAGWFFLAVDVIIPHFRGAPYKHLARYLHLVEPFVEGDINRATFGQVLWHMAAHPFAVGAQLLTLDRAGALIKLMGPSVGLAFVGLPELTPVAPSMAANLLALSDRQHAFQLHYPFSMVPYVYVAAAAGAATLARRAGPGAGRRMAFWTAAVLFCSLALCRWHGEMPFSKPFAWEKYRPDERAALGRKLLKVVPPGVAVSAQSGLGSHLANRRSVYQFPQLADATLIALDLESVTRPGGIWPLIAPSDYVDKVEETLNSGEWGVTELESGYCLIVKGASTARNPEAIGELRRNAQTEH